jgi:large conductance mechanosensitive channel
MNDKEASMLAEFRKFILRGNVIDLAVAVILGGAFGAIVTSLTNDIIMPLIGMILGGVDFSTLAVTVGSAVLAYGKFIQAIVNFLLIGFSLFLIVRAMNRMMESRKAPAVPAAPPADIVLLTEIRDLLRERRM